MQWILSLLNGYKGKVKITHWKTTYMNSAFVNKR